jgi:hypothetical protein
MNDAAQIQAGDLGASRDEADETSAKCGGMDFSVG